MARPPIPAKTATNSVSFCFSIPNRISLRQPVASDGNLLENTIRFVTSFQSGRHSVALANTSVPAMASSNGVNSRSMVLDCRYWHEMSALNISHFLPKFV